MAAQYLIVFSVVLACGVYAMWVLMPSALRRLLATHLARLPLGSALKTTFLRATDSTTACGCNGCDKVGTRRDSVNVIHIERRNKS